MAGILSPVFGSVLPPPDGLSLREGGASFNVACAETGHGLLPIRRAQSYSSHDERSPTLRSSPGKQKKKAGRQGAGAKGRSVARLLNAKKDSVTDN